MDLLVLILLSRKIRKIIREKEGLKPNLYVITLLLLWFSIGLLFVFIGMKLFGELTYALFFGLIGEAIGGYLGYKLAINAEPVVENDNDSLF
ncbi:hypothetical protein [Carboxylicivirga caseinilyticus]|uniref:hypothetical protein n=1 Tax=Carboxylicivirga caseinilyticus TaxID=3417572 RepID=UPI003D3358BC|nr:hypothetical protein [Marinilabiliaceae bacterium A049]